MNIIMEKMLNTGVYIRTHIGKSNHNLTFVHTYIQGVRTYASITTTYIYARSYGYTQILLESLTYNLHVDYIY